MAVVAGVMVIGILATAQYWVVASKVAGNKEESKKSHESAATVALNGSIQYDVDHQKAGSENPANITMCDGDLHGCQGFDILVSTDPGLGQGLPPSMGIITRSLMKTGL